MACAEDVFAKLERCTNEQEKQDLGVVRKAIDAGIDFVCHNDGDRIACKYVLVCWVCPQNSPTLAELLLLQVKHAQYQWKCH